MPLLLNLTPLPGTIRAASVKPLQTCLLILLLLSSICLPATAEDGSSVLALQSQPTISPVQANPYAGMLLSKQRTLRSLNQIYEFDRTPLGDRVPVILIPGRAEEFQQNAWWKEFNHTARRNAPFRHRFKLYVFLYNSKEELDAQARGLAVDLKKRFGHLEKSQPLMLVTYSLGGVIAREVMKEPGILEKIDTQIAVAVPFHGSPIFDPDWFSQYLNPLNRSPIRRFWDRGIYRAYMWRKSNLTRGLRWDNFDSSKPQFQPNRVKITGDQASPLLSRYQEYPMADEIRTKTIVYASYLENGYTHTNQKPNPLKLPRFVLDRSVNFPREMLGSILPMYGFTVHSVFTYMNAQMANLPTFTPEDPQGKNTHLYRYNDGAIPLSSMLFLKPSKTPYDQDITEMTRLATVRSIRIFANLDHIHLGEYALNKSMLIKPDMLHPEEGMRSPNGWVMYDLLQRRNSPEFVNATAVR
jgi:hypothetical protein